MLVCIGIPTLDGRPYCNLVDSLMAEQLLGYDQGVHFLILWEVGCSLIGVARNKIAKRFMDIPQAECLVFVDADISWTGGDLAKLAKRPEDVIGATYRAKRDDDYFHVRGLPEKHGDLYRVSGLPGGFMKISRHAFKSIQCKSYLDEDDKPMADYFPTGMHNGQIFGEDYGFCRQWTASGGSVFLDTSIKLRHHDGLRFYTGDPQKWVDHLTEASDSKAAE